MDKSYYDKKFKELCDITIELNSLALDWLTELPESSDNTVPAKMIFKANKIVAALLDCLGVHPESKVESPQLIK